MIEIKHGLGRAGARPLALLALLCAGCSLTGLPVTPLSPETLAVPGRLARQTETGLPVVRLRAGSGLVIAEVARTPLQKAAGLASRPRLAQDDGMLFVNQYPQRAVYNTRDTLMPLSCAYIAADGTVLELHDMNARDMSPVVSVSDRVQYVLEVNRGWFRQHGVRAGDRIAVEDP